MISNRLYVGIDSHSKSHKVVLVPSSMLRQLPKSLKEPDVMDVHNTLNDYHRLTRSIRGYTKIADEVRIGIDSCGIYSLPITYYLQKQNYRVYYMEQKLSKVSRGYIFDLENKSDIIDAIRIAYLLYIKDVTGSLFSSTACRIPDLDSSANRLHSLVLQRQQYSKLLTQITNRLHAFLTGIFPEGEEKYFSQLLKVLPYYPTPKEISRSRRMTKIKGIGKTTEINLKTLAKKTVGIPADNYVELILKLCKQRKVVFSWLSEITHIIDIEVNKHPYGGILLSFPRLGVVAAATLIGMIGDINKWDNDKKLKKAFGTYSSFQQSGKYLNNRRQGTRGSRLCKTALYQVVILCLPDNVPENDFRDYYRHKVSRGKKKMTAIVATMGKLTEIIYHCLKTGQPYVYQGIYKDRKSRYKKSRLQVKSI
jgi:transposase